MCAVLAAGGSDFGTGAQASAELYDTSTGAWTATGSLITGRFGLQMVLLADGKGKHCHSLSGGFLPIKIRATY